MSSSVRYDRSCLSQPARDATLEIGDVRNAGFHHHRGRMGTSLSNFTVDEVGLVPRQFGQMVRKFAEGSETTALNVSAGVFIPLPDIKEDSIKSVVQQLQGLLYADFLHAVRALAIVSVVEGFRDGGRFSTEGTGWVCLEGDFPPPSVGRIVMKHSSGEARAIPCYDLEHLHGLQSPDHAGKDAKDARFFSGGDCPRRWWLRKEAAVAGGGELGVKDTELPFKLMDSARYQWSALQPGSIGYDEAGREII